MNKYHAFIIAKDFNTRLRVPCRVRKYGAKKVYGANNVYPTREACVSAIVQDEVFEYTQRDGQKVLIDLVYIRKHCKFLGCDECVKDEFDNAFRRSGLERKDFTRVLDMGDVLVSNFNMFFWICDCGTNELWVREEDCHSMGPVFDQEKLDGVFAGVDIAPAGSGTTVFGMFKTVDDDTGRTIKFINVGDAPIRFTHIGDNEENRFRLIIGGGTNLREMDNELLNVRVQHDDGVFKLVEQHSIKYEDFVPVVEQFDMVIENFLEYFLLVEGGRVSLYKLKEEKMISPVPLEGIVFQSVPKIKERSLNQKPNHDFKACAALREYDTRSIKEMQEHGKDFDYMSLMKEVAEAHDTTPEEMRKHWPCISKLT